MKEAFEEKGKQLAKESLQKGMPEAVASVSYTATTPNGYSIIFTMRDAKESSLFERMEAIEAYLQDAGYSPNGKSVSKRRTEPSVSIEDATGDVDTESFEARNCPKCGEPLVEIEAKDKPALRCSTNKWDPKTKTASGCDFFAYIEPATEKQKEMLKDKNLWVVGLTKGEATEIIGKIFGK